LIFLVFAFVQKAAADTAREHAVENEKRARQNAEIANHLTVELEQCRQLNSK
jgi:predicted nuclease of restriction endonuclease-like RecB superfamily